MKALGRRLPYLMPRVGQGVLMEENRRAWRPALGRSARDGAEPEESGSGTLKLVHLKFQNIYFHPV